MFAGPGSGKTRTLTARIAALLAGRPGRARQILALTFTVRAAEEMRVRLTAAIGGDAAGDVTVATFHALGARILRENATVFGRTPAYSIYDADDVLRVIRAGLKDGDPAGAPGRPREGGARADHARQEPSLVAEGPARARGAPGPRTDRGGLGAHGVRAARIQRV